MDSCSLAGVTWDLVDYDQVLRDLTAEQKPHRLHHILGVLQTCVTLGTLHDGNLEQLGAAAVLHDCAKHLGREETLSLLREHNMELSKEDMEYPAIWHGAAGRVLAKTRYGVTDETVLDAVLHHTLGVPDPTKTLRILMCADFTEPTRTHPGVGDTRNLIRADLDEGLKFVLRAKVVDLQQRGLRPHSRIFDTMRSLEI